MDIKPFSYPEIDKNFPIVFPKDLIDLHVKLKQNLYISFFFSVPNQKRSGDPLLWFLK